MILKLQALLPGIVEREIQEGLALGLYASRKLSLEKAAEIAGLRPHEFQNSLRRCCIPQHYSSHEIQDLHPKPRGDSPASSPLIPATGTP